ncbi:hypothetical protein BKA70DRAFT_1180120 [Coprinopsis sp. MPI-PUGE-AT-0042]|nr:hypothetical protein BKA70DRAFT_1180120 [Coprinopsis sp. MPI-PUGE-AT-0042]
MPSSGRRPSAAAPPSSAYSSTRTHKSTDSNQVYGMPGPSSTAVPSLSSSSAANPQQPVVQGLVKRLALKLPIHSGMPLDKLENDPLIEQTIDTLVELSGDSLDLIAWTLCELADRLAKQTDSAPGGATIQILQSQLFILKVLALTMASRWRSDQARSPPDSPGSRQRGPGSTNSMLPDAAPMEDTCAKYILSVMVLFLRHTSGFDVPLMLDTESIDMSFRDFEVPETMNLTGNAGDSVEEARERVRLRTQRSNTSIGGSSMGSTMQAHASRTYEKTHLSLIQNPAAVKKLIAKYTGRIIFHISGANWNVVCHRLRTKIRFLSTSQTDDSSDHADLQIMTHSMMDRKRLLVVLNDISSLMININREAQLAIAIHVRTAVWNWIDRFPEEFNEAIRTKPGIVKASESGAGIPERVFDMLYTLSTYPGNERIVWPTLTMLSCMTSERISNDLQNPGYGSAKRKETRFAQDLVRHLTAANSRLADVALVCCIDFCRAAALISGSEVHEIPLRLLALDLAHEVRSMLFNTASTKAFWDTQEDIDVPLFAEALVTVFRFLPENEVVNIFRGCMEPERSDAVKTCVVRACLTLCQDAPRLPMQPSLVNLQVPIGARFRDVLAASASGRLELDQYKNIKRAASRPKRKPSEAEPLGDKEVLLLAILATWRQYPWWLLKGVSEHTLDQWTAVTVKVWDTPLDLTVKMSTASCLCNATERCFVTPPTYRSAELAVYAMKRSLPMTLQSVAANLMNNRTDFEAQTLWITLAHSLIDMYNRKIPLDHVKAIQFDETRVPALTLAEISLMISLTASAVNLSNLAAKGLRLLAQVEQNPGAPISSILGEDELRKRNFIYEQLGDPNVVVVGRAGHQKRIRKLIRLISYTSPIHSAVWAECYARWRAISQPVYDALNEELNGSTNMRYAFMDQQQELRFQWQNLTLFLATLCGACAGEKPDMSPLVNAIPPEYLPDRIRAVQHIPALAESFIGDLIALLLHHDAFCRDTARDALGSELSPRFYPKLIRFMDEQMRGVEQGAGPQLKQDYIMFLDQFITVLKNLAENSHGPSEELISVDVSSLMLSIAEFVARYDEPASQRIKIKYCMLLKLVCERSEILSIRKDSQIRHTILDLVLDWLQPPERQDGGPAEHRTQLTTDLNMACLRTAVKLLDRLQLKSADVSNSPDETLHVVSGLFKRYADRLMSCLDRSKADPATSDSASDLGSVHQRMRVSQKEAELRDLVITGLTHLVTANSETGFKQCLPLAYDDDHRKRAIFAHVFARVIGEGTTFEPQEKVIPPNKHARFSELLRGSDMVLAMTICEVCPVGEVEMMVSVLLNVFDTRSSLIALMKLMVEREISGSESENQMFRSNSTSNRLLSAFAKIHGYMYLRSIINPLIRVMIKAPAIANPGDDHGPPADFNVTYAASQLISIISASKDTMPTMIREVCAHIGKTVADVYPDSKIAAVGAFVFLRFLSPAIVSPETIDVEFPKDKSEAAVRKGLRLVARAVQTLVNQLFSGEVPAHMTTLLQESGGKIYDFLDNLLDPQIAQAEANDVWTGVTPEDTDIIVLHRFFDKHADKIGKELLSLSKPSTEGDKSAVNGKRAWDGLCALLVDLGPPLEVPRPSNYTSQEHGEYIDLMSDYNGRNTSRVKELFVEMEEVWDDHAYFVFRLAKVDVEDLDIQLLMYHIFKILTSEAYAHLQFDIIIDCTSFSPVSEVPLHWLRYCAEVMPSDIRNRFRTAHFLNPNYLAQKYLRRLYNVSAGTPFCNDIKAYPSVIALQEAGLPAQVLVALSYPASIEEEPIEALFPSVTLKVLHTRVAVDIQVSVKHVRITTRKAHSVSATFACRYVEIIPLTDVVDVYNIMTHDQSEFLIRRRHSIMYFLSPDRDTIVKAIRSAKGKLKEVQAPLSDRFSRFSNIPATLLHIGLLSVDPTDEELRSAAYDLLGAVCAYLKYDKSPIVARKAGFIPGESLTFVTHLSEKLADFAPQLTLDFIHEVLSAMAGMGDGPKATPRRVNCLHYISPWIRNLSSFANPASKYEKSGSRLRDCVRLLTDLSITYPQIISSIQKCIWVEVAKLDIFVVDAILDELIRTAADSGVASQRCETVAQIVGALSSITVRSRMYSRLRKALGRTPGKSIQPPTSLTEHQSWNEISTVVRLIAALGSMQNRLPGPNQLLIPELCHLVTIVASEGLTLVRKSVYGTVLNVLQALYVTRGEELSEPDLLQLIDSCTTPATLKLFGLARETSTSEYHNWDPQTDREQLDQLEELVALLIRVTEVASGSRGLLNIWRARWMSLVTSTAFQLNPVVQTRSFIALGALSNADVDDDFVYQIMVALKGCFTQATDNNTIIIVSILRCLCRLVPALPDTSRYVPMFFWLAVALLQSAHTAFFCEAANLLTLSITAMENLGHFRQQTVPKVMLEYRQSLEDVTNQLDDMLGISFETHFSLALSHVIFKGLRHGFSKDAAENALRCLLSISARTHSQFYDRTLDGYNSVLCSDVLGYFLALLPLSTSVAAYRKLLKECLVEDAWYGHAGLPDTTSEGASLPKVSPTFLDILDEDTALLVATFAATTVCTAQGDDAETEMLYGLLSELASAWPEVIALVYESLREKIQDTFANSSNPTTIRYATNIFRIWMTLHKRGTILNYDPQHASSASTLDRPEEKFLTSPDHLNALEDLGMRGLSFNLVFLPSGQGQATKVINWITNLVTLIS